MKVNIRGQFYRYIGNDGKFYLTDTGAVFLSFGKVAESSSNHHYNYLKLFLPILPCVDVPVVELLVQIQEESIVCDVGQNVFRLWPGGALHRSTNWSALWIQINWIDLDHFV